MNPIDSLGPTALLQGTYIVLSSIETLIESMKKLTRNSEKAKVCKCNATREGVDRKYMLGPESM